MSVVFITIPGDDKKSFVNRLHERIGKDLKLVIVQKRKKRTLFGRFKKFYKDNRDNFLREVWYSFLLRLNPRTRVALKYFRKSTLSAPASTYFVKTLDTVSVNDDSIHKTLEELSPDLLVVWGSGIIEPRILNTAKKAINLHFGLCPYYRGALANQQAYLHDDFDKIGATIHYVNDKPDAGDILRTISADSSKLPKEMFCDLNDTAICKFLDVIEKINAGGRVRSKPQDIKEGVNCKLRDWTPSVRYKLGKKLVTKS